jgi:hypothetical protein
MKSKPNTIPGKKETRKGDAEGEENETGVDECTY